MKGALERYKQRWGNKSYSVAMNLYENQLNQLVGAAGDGKSYKQNNEKLMRRISPNEVVAVRALDDNRYYRTVLIKANPFTSGFQTLVSNPVMGETPDGIREVSQEQVFKQMREMNSNTQNLNAFPFRGQTGNFESAPGAGLVSQQHKNLQKRNDR